MKYQLMVRCIPDEKQSIQDRHLEIARILDQMSSPWGFDSKGGPPPPDPGRELLAECRLGPFLGRGVRGSLVYRYRGGLGDAAMYDDYLQLVFNPARVDYEALVRSVLPQYIKGLRPYRAELGPEELTIIDFDAARRVDDRHGVFRIYPVTYLGQQVCLEAFGRMPNDLVERLAPACASATVLGEGALLVARVDPVTVEGANQVNEDLWSRLGRKPGVGGPNRIS